MKKKSDGRFFGGGGAYIREDKHCNLQSVELTFLSFFSSIKHVFRHFSRRARSEMFKINNKDTVDVVLASLLLTLNTFQILLKCLYC